MNRYFENAAFMNYLQYLKYWKQPQYAKYIVNPHCLNRGPAPLSLRFASSGGGAASRPAPPRRLSPRLGQALCLGLDINSWTVFAFLDMLDDDQFRQMIAREDFMTLVHGQQFYHWQTFLNNRSEGKPEEMAPTAEMPAAAAPAETS
ncbi:Mediator of RNA polymerase II transcription subunit 31 [Phytophthora pseudosyringae]|uniref:Mediator of RNA polymerase II transcription subunit 31 n=1 Tax=Phytophthora pseudosyringae TaxID=221518 RepID=A0A8T1VAF6_9STRA|nr:Mediator of RNA polymerase II transcription subunit 31 [Phytophthora pseudosyringae]